MKKFFLILISVFLCSSVPVSAKAEKDNRIWQDETVYSIMIDRFNNGDIKNDVNVNTNNPSDYNGGDLQGIIDKLDYIHDMGFTAIKLTPIFDNADKGYHGYWITNFYKVDEHFGTIKTMQRLVKEAHKRKMKVIVDFVANNTAATHPWLSEPDKQDWFHKRTAAVDWNNPQQAETGLANGLPDLNQENPLVKQYLINVAKWWIGKTDIDGYSLPEVNYVPVSFWEDFSKAVKQEKPDFFLVGIPAANSAIDVKALQSAGIDNVFDYNYSAQLRQVFANTNHPFASIGESTGFTAGFFDNEYTPRFTKDIVEQRQFPGSRWKTALTYLYTTPGIPFVFYGTEIALNGGGVPDNRGQMSFRTEKDLIEYITKLGELRKQLPSLTRGTMEMLYDQNGMAVYKRSYQGETTIIAINNTRKSQKVVLTASQVEGGKELRGLLAGDLVRSHNRNYILITDRDKSEIYVLAEKSGLNLPLIAAVAISGLLVLLFLILIIRRAKRNQAD